MAEDWSGDWDDPADAALLAELAGVLRGMTVPPPEVVDAAKQSFTWRTVDAELAALTHDSLLDEEPVLARAAAAPRILTFEVGAMLIEVEIDAAPSGRRIFGQLVPGAEVDIELRVGEPGEVAATGRSDRLGRFVLPLPADPRLVSLRCRPPGGSAVQTARVRL